MEPSQAIDVADTAPPSIGAPYGGGYYGGAIAIDGRAYAEAFRDAIEDAVNCGLGKLQHEADIEAAAAAEALDDAIREVEGRQPALFPCEVTA